MSFTPFNAPLLAPLLGDMEIAKCFTVKADVTAMIRFECALAKAQSKVGMIPEEHARHIEQAMDGFEPDLAALSEQVATDGMAVPELVRLAREVLDPETAKSFHFDSTSQDVIDTSAMIRLREAMRVLASRLDELCDLLKALARSQGGNTLMGYTRMQAALPIAAPDRVRRWTAPLINCAEKGKALDFPVQLGGPVGADDAYQGKARALCEDMAAALGLSAPQTNWQTDRTVILEIGQWLATLTGHLGKLGADVCLMAQTGEEQIQLSGGGGSSAMAHKKNPVLAESLVTLARFNAGQIGTLHQCLVHEQERSGASWTLEWMIMPQMFVAAGAALRNANRLAHSIEQIGA